MLLKVCDELAPKASMCCPCCNATYVVRLAALQLGTQINKNAVVLPPCTCGAQETLLRTFTGADDEHAKHRKSVNAIAEWLKGTGKVHPDHAEAFQTEIANGTRPALISPLITE